MILLRSLPMNKLVDEAPYHPGYEDAVVNPAQKYKGMNPAKMIWKSKPLSDEEIMDIAEQSDYSTVEIEMGYDYEIRIARAIEERHGIK